MLSVRPAGGLLALFLVNLGEGGLHCRVWRHDWEGNVDNHSEAKDFSTNFTPTPNNI